MLLASDSSRLLTACGSSQVFFGEWVGPPAGGPAHSPEGWMRRGKVAKCGSPHPGRDQLGPYAPGFASLAVGGYFATSSDNEASPDGSLSLLLMPKPLTIHGVLLLHA